MLPAFLFVVIVTLPNSDAGITYEGGSEKKIVSIDEPELGETAPGLSNQC
jgi:hypothetical protein